MTMTKAAKKKAKKSKKPGRRRAKKVEPDDNLVIISDTHIGCGMALCHPDGVELDDGGTYVPSKVQRQLYAWWDEFWNKWVPKVTLGDPYTVVHAGDAIDGTHHNSVTQISHNLMVQRRHAEKLLGEVVKLCEGRYYHIRGTEAHVGQSAQEEEALARNLGAVPDEEGKHARYELWKKVGGKRGGLCHIMHHIGTTGSSSYESSAVMRELTEAFVEAGRWGDEPPRAIIRAHRHRHIDVGIEGKDGKVLGLVTPGWQLKTPFVYKIPGGRSSQPQIGGIVVRYHRDELYYRAKVWRPERPKTVG